MLEVGTDRVNIRNAKSKKVHVTLPLLTALKISSAGDCKGQGLFHCDDLELGISSAGDLDLEVEARRIDLDISSSGDCRLAGKADVFNASLSSAGDLHAFDLMAGQVKVDVSSAGDARVYATDEISMNASSAGNIYYKGDAQVIRIISKSSAGNIVKMGLTQVAFKDFAPGGVFQPFDGFFLDLPYPFTGQVKLFPDLFQGMGMFSVEPEIQPDDAGFPVGKGA